MKLKIWGWDKKERTMLRFLKSGDIFCFLLSESTFALGLNKNMYGFGRIIAKVNLGHTAEIFNYFSHKPEIDENIIKTYGRAFRPIILSSYILFDRKTIGDWRIIGKEEKYIHSGDDDVFFIWGDPSSPKKSNIYGKSSIATKDDVNIYPYEVAETDKTIKNSLFTDKIIEEIIEFSKKSF